MIAVVEPQPLLAEHLASCVRAAGLATASLDDARYALVCVDASVPGWSDTVELVGIAGLAGVVYTSFDVNRAAVLAADHPGSVALARPFSPEQLRFALRSIGALGAAAVTDQAATDEVADDATAIDEADVLDDVVEDEVAAAAAANEALSYAADDESADELVVDEGDVLDELESLPAFASAAVDDATMRLARTLSGEVGGWSELSGEERVRTVYAFLAAYARGET